MADPVVTLRLVANSGQLVGELRTTRAELTQLGNAGNQAGAQAGAGLDQGAAGANRFARETAGATSVLKSLTAAALGGAGIAGVTAALVGSVAQARNFGKAMAEVSTLLDDTSSVDGMTESVRAMAREYGQAPTEQAKALYQIISAGASDSAAALAILDTSNKLALGGITSVERAADGLTTILNAYGPAAGSAASVSDKMFAAMKAGKTTIDQLAGSIGSVAPIASQAGVSLDEVLAAASALTKGGVSTSTAMNGVRAAIAATLKPSAEAEKLANSLGLQFDAAALKSKGFAAFLDDVQRATGGSAEQLAVLFGGVEALAPVMALTGTQAGDFRDILDQVASSAGQTEVAVAKMQDTAEFAFKRLQAEVGERLTSLGELMLNVLVPAAQVLAGNLDVVVAVLVSRLAVAAIPAAIAAFGGLTAGMGAAAVAAKGLGVAMTLAGGPIGIAAAALAFLTIKTMEWAKASQQLRGDAKLAVDALEEVSRATDKTRLQSIAAIAQIRSEAAARLSLAKAALEEARAKYQADLSRNTSSLGFSVSALQQVTAAEQKVDQLTRAIAKVDEAALAAAKDGLKAFWTGLGASRDAAAEVPPEAARLIQAIESAGAAARRAGQDAEQASRDFARMAEDAGRAGSDLLRILDAQAAQIGGPSVRAALEYRDALGDLLDIEYRLMALGPVSIEQQAMLAQARTQAAELYRRETEDGAHHAVRAAGDGARAWTDFSDLLVDAMGRGMRGVKDLFGRMLQDLVKQLLSSQILRLMASVFGGSMPGLAAAATQGSGQSMLGAMLSGGQGGGLNLGSLAGGITSGGGIVGGINSGLFGSAGIGGMLAGLGGSIGAFGAGMTVAGSAGLMAAGQFGIASLAAGNLAVGLGALVPVVGWIAAAAGAINSLTGGRLFGTSYKPDSSANVLSIGASGASASATVTETRQRSLFRGRTPPRTRTLAASDEAVQAAQDLYAAVRQTMVQSAQMLRADAPEMLSAALRVVHEYDKKGKVTATKIFVDVLGRSWQEATEELAQKRIMAEAIIATIDSALGTVPQAVGASAAGAISDAMDGAFGDAGREFGEGVAGIFHALKSASAGAAAAAQGEASAIAERWRGDAETLLDGATMLLAAATDIRRGAGLLGDGSLTQIADLIEELAQGGEPLAAAYQRVVASVTLLDQALAMSGITLDKTREDVVRFAVDIADAAGGIERASALWTSYFARFYTDSERLAFQLGQAVSQAVSQFADIGLDLDQFRGDGGAAAFRELFESLLPTLSAAAIVEWLEAAEALGIVIELSDQAAAALGEVSDGLGAIAASLDDFMQGIEREIAAFAPPLTFAERIELINKGLGVLITRAEAMGATEEQLARVRLLGQLQLQEVLDEQRAALREYSDFVGQFADAGTPLTEFGRTMRGIEQTMLDNIERANQLAIAAGLQGAAEEDLAQIHAFAARQAARAMMEMERAILSTAASLGYLQTQQTQLDRVNAEIERIGRDPYASLAFADRLEELFARRAELEAMDPAAYEQAAAFASRLRDLAAAAGETAIETINRLGITAEALLADLGFSAGADLADTSVADALVSAARLLGVEVADLAARMGVDVGDLADPDSVINDAFERLIGRLPDALRGGVAEAFAAFEAGDPGAREALVALINGLPSNLRQLFEPLLDEVDPEAFEDSLLAGQNAANGYLSTAADHLAAIRAAIEAPQPGGPGRGPGEKSAEAEQLDRVIAAEERSEQTIDRRTQELSAEVRAMRAALDEVSRTLIRLSTQISLGASS